jgi:DNA-binding NarL/FixJ family response regulator
MSSSLPVRILMYEDNDMLRQSMQTLLEMDGRFIVVAAYAHPLSIINDVKEHQPSVILMDIDMPGKNGVEAVQELRNINGELPVIMLTVFEDNENIFNALCAGASGYLLKKSNPAQIINAVFDVLEGGAPMTSSIAKKVLQLFPRAPEPSKEQSKTEPQTGNLTPREVELIRLFAKGYSYKMIAAELSISVETVRTHIKNIYKKMQVHSAIEAANKAREKGIL